MEFWVGITDGDWFDHLSKLKPEEVNFWQPGPTPPKRMDPGTPFLFKLHAPQNFVVGGGFFLRFTVLPCFLAWEAYGEKNGVSSLPELVARMTRYRDARQTPASQIGCNLLAEPFFFTRNDWIPIPENWRGPTQRGKTYDSNERYGAELWEAVSDRLSRIRAAEAHAVEYPSPQYSDEFLAHARLGQGAFRILVTDAYHRRCAVTGERTLPALEAAHIKAYSDRGPHRVDNGLLLRADIHRLFDDGYATVDPDLRFLVSRRVREEFKNGREYYRFHGARVQNLPEALSQQPSREFLEWHNQHSFVD